MQIPFFRNIKSPHIKKYAANTLWVFTDFILKQGLSIIVGIFVARHLKPARFGILSYSSVYLQILMPLALLGLNQITIRELIKKTFDFNHILGTSFFLKLISSLFTLLLIVLFAFVFEQKQETRIYIIIASSSILLSPLQVIDFYFQAEVKSKYVVYSQQISSLVTSILRLLLVYLSANLIYFVSVFVIDVLISSVFLFYFFNKNEGAIGNWRFDKEIFHFFKKEILNIMLASFFVALYVRIDQVMIRYLTNEVELGIYTAAVKLCEPFYVVATLLVSSLFPAIVNGLSISELEFKRRVQKLYNLLVWIAIITSSIISLFAPLIIKIVYGIDYLASSSVLIIYFWASPFVFLGVVASNVMMIEKKQFYTVLATLGGAVINIFLNFIFIPKFGVNGAAAATLISYAMASYLLNGIFKPTRNIFYQQTISLISLPNLIRNYKEFFTQIKTRK